jgi:hypothetical protein
MEYAMSTLMLGNGTLEGIWYSNTWIPVSPYILASNESKHPMDEGFTTYISNWLSNFLIKVANPLQEIIEETIVNSW